MIPNIISKRRVLGSDIRIQYIWNPSFDENVNFAECILKVGFAVTTTYPYSQFV